MRPFMWYIKSVPPLTPHPHAAYWAPARRKESLFYIRALLKKISFTICKSWPLTPGKNVRSDVDGRKAVNLHLLELNYRTLLLLRNIVVFKRCILRQLSSKILKMITMITMRQYEVLFTPDRDTELTTFKVTLTSLAVDLFLRACWLSTKTQKSFKITTKVWE